MTPSIRSSAFTSLAVALVAGVASHAAAIPPPPQPGDFRVPCEGGPLDVGANIILDYGRSITTARTFVPPAQTSLIPQPADFNLLGDADVLHVVNAGGFDLRGASQCPVKPHVLRLGDTACYCLRGDIEDCIGPGRRGGPGLPADLFTCPPSANDCCIEAEDGARVIACRPVAGGRVELDLEVTYFASGAHRPHLYSGIVNLDSQEIVHEWQPVAGEHGRMAPGRNEPPGQQARRTLAGPPGRQYPPGMRYATQPAARTVPMTLVLDLDVQHYLQLTLVEGGPDEVVTPPEGILGAGETEAYLIFAETVPGGVQVQLVAEGPGSVPVTCDGF